MAVKKVSEADAARGISSKVGTKKARVPSSSDKIQAGNLQEEASEILSGCIKCGMCKSLCPVFKILREEQFSPRGKAILLNEKILDKVVFHCNLCKACEEKCPLGLKVCDAILKAREAMVLQGKELKENKEMIDNVRKNGNPFGDGSGKFDGKFYCC
jgi:heterodisulfide reductase subunit C